MSLTSDWNKLPTPIKWGARVGAGFLAWKGGKYLWGKLNPSSYENVVSASSDQAKAILKKNASLPPNQRVIASYTPAQMKIFANKLFTALDGVGTDYPGLIGVFSNMKNDLDILLLIKEFGTRTGTGTFAGGTPQDLATWLADDKVTTFVNKALSATKKITFRF